MQNKPEWYYKQSAVIPYRKNGNDYEVLLITSRNKQNWILPKGIIELGMTPEDSAAKEAMEEAGVAGFVLNELIGEYDFEKWGGTCKVKVFPMKVKKVFDNWPEADIRSRRWFTIEKAMQKVNKNDLTKILKNFRDNYLEQLQKK